MITVKATASQQSIHYITFELSYTRNSSLEIFDFESMRCVRYIPSITVVLHQKSVKEYYKPNQPVSYDSTLTINTHVRAGTTQNMGSVGCLYLIEDPSKCLHGQVFTLSLRLLGSVANHLRD